MNCKLQNKTRDRKNIIKENKVKLLFIFNTETGAPLKKVKNIKRFLLDIQLLKEIKFKTIGEGAKFCTDIKKTNNQGLDISDAYRMEDEQNQRMYRGI